MKVKFCIFNKEANSISVPTSATTWTEFDCFLKDSCAIENPVIRLKTASYNLSWNYCYIPSWSRYYFIGDAVINTDGSTVIQLVEDYLGTWKTNVLATSCLIGRSDSAGDKYQMDGMLSHDCKITTTKTDIGALANYNTNGTVIVNITGTPSAGTITKSLTTGTLYVMSTATYGNLWETMFEQVDDWESPPAGSLLSACFGDLSDPDTQRLCMSFFNPTQFIQDVLWLPFEVNIIGSTSEASTGKVNGLSTNVMNMSFVEWEHAQGNNTIGKLDTYSSLTTSFTIPASAWSSDSSTNWTHYNDEWNHYELFVPMFGQIEIPAKLYGKVITGNIMVDIPSGNATLSLSSGTETTVFARYYASAGIHLQITNIDKSADSFLNVRNATNSAVSNVVSTAGQALMFGSMGNTGATSAFTGNSALAGIGSAQSGTVLGKIQGMQGSIGGAVATAGAIVDGINQVGNAKMNACFENMMPTMGLSGMPADVNSYKDITHVYLYRRYYTAVESIEHIQSAIGLPCNKYYTLSSLTGFTQCINPRCKINGTYGEQAMLNNILESGVIL